jgi:hypothetical protein
MRGRLVILTALLALLAGCFDQKGLFNKLIPEAEDQFARKFLESVRAGDMPGTLALLDGSTEEAATRQGLEDLRRLFTQSALVEIETIGFQMNWTLSADDQRRRVTRLDYQLSLEKHWLSGTVILVGEGDQLKVNTARFNPLPASLGVLNAFTLEGKSVLHFVVLAFAMIVPLFCLTALVICIKTKVRRKWLWILFILLPLGMFRLNWTNGAWETQILSINLLGGGIVRSGLYAPWILSVGLPVGAVLFLVWRKSLTISTVPPPVPQ